jgi:hypothetical protein
LRWFHFRGDCHENLASAEGKAEELGFDKPRSLPANSGRLRL